LQNWRHFAAQWQQYEKYMLLGMPAGEITDMIRRDTLVSCLQGALHRRQVGELQMRPHLTFQEIWTQLARTYEVDDPHAARRRWQAIRLNRAGDSISLQNFLTFSTEFKLANQQVSDWTDQEVLDLVLKQ
jgi:hypothetical protein